MALVVKVSNANQALPSNLPPALPQLPPNADPQLLVWQQQMNVWYQNFLLAYNAQTQQILIRISKAGTNITTQ